MSFWSKSKTTRFIIWFHSENITICSLISIPIVIQFLTDWFFMSIQRNGWYFEPMREKVRFDAKISHNPHCCLFISFESESVSRPSLHYSDYLSSIHIIFQNKLFWWTKYLLGEFWKLNNFLSTGPELRLTNASILRLTKVNELLKYLERCQSH